MIIQFGDFSDEPVIMSCKKTLQFKLEWIIFYLLLKKHKGDELYEVLFLSRICYCTHLLFIEIFSNKK
jgi:hypothetical protein